MCPLECVELSAHALKPLRRERLFGPFETIGDVLTAGRKGDFAYVRNLGPVRMAEIEATLISTGFDVGAGAGCRRRQART